MKDLEFELKRNQCQFSHVKLSDSSTQGTCLTTEIPTDEVAVLLKIPRDFCITGNSLFTALKESDNQKLLELIRNAVLKLETKLNERLMIVLYVLLSRDLFHSKHREYLKLLPKNLNNPLFWSFEELETYLNGTPLFDAVISKKQHMERLYNQINDCLFSCIEAFVPCGVSLEDFVWAESVISSRVISVSNNTFKSSSNFNFKDFRFEKEDLYLVPLLDMCNHSASPNARWEITDDSILLETYPDTPLLPGTELFISYGEISNSNLLFNYGFSLVEHFKYETLHFPVFISEEDPFATQKISLLKRYSLPSVVEISYANLGGLLVIEGHLLDYLFNENQSLALSIASMDDDPLSRVNLDDDTFSITESDKFFALSQVFHQCCSRIDQLQQQEISLKEEATANLRCNYSSIYRQSLKQLLVKIISVIEDFISKYM